MPKHRENPFLNLGFNIVIPVLLLNKGQDWTSLSPVFILLISLAFPFCYGLKDFILIKKINYISIIGLLNTALTGGFALLKLEGVYFAIKEGGVPLFLALVLIFSVILKKPIMEWMIFKSSLFNETKIKQQLKLKNNHLGFKKLMNQSTLFLSASLVLSAIMNFIVALYVFLDIDPSLTKQAQANILNKQVADMTWMGYVFIALPLSVVTVVIMFWIFKKLKFLTDLSLDEIISHTKSSSKESSASARNPSD